MFLDIVNPGAAATRVLILSFSDQAQLCSQQRAWENVPEINSFIHSITGQSTAATVTLRGLMAQRPLEGNSSLKGRPMGED